jgi:hypothetical protein
LGQTIHWDFKAASFEDVTVFEMTECNTDEVDATVGVNLTGEGGPYGSFYYSRGVLTTIPSHAVDCIVKVRARGEGTAYSPWAQVHYNVVDPAIKATDLIKMEILAPTEGENLPVDAAYPMSFKGVSVPEITHFQFEHCNTQAGWLIPLNPESTSDAGVEGTNYFADLTLISSEAGPCTLRARAVVEEPVLQFSKWAEVHFSFGPSLTQVTPGVPAILPTPTNTPGGSWQATAKMNANCRAGPSTAHNEWGYALKNDIVEVVGRNEDGTWLNVLNPHGAGKCWLSIFALDVPFDVNGLPAVSYPTPPPSDDSAGQPPAAQGCLVVNAATGELTCVAPCPPGAAPERACTP